VVLRESSTDGKVFEEIFIEKTYTPHARAFARKAPVLLIDLGANIGLSAIALARELRPVAMVAVEPDQGNFAMLEENLRRAKLTARCTAVQAFAGVARGFAELVDSGNGAWGMRMGAAARTGIPVLPIEEIIGMAEGMAEAIAEARVDATGPAATRADATGSDATGSDATGPPTTGTDTTGAEAMGPGLRNGAQAARPLFTTVLKCDIEGAETHLFHQLRQWEDRVHYVILELHTEFLSPRDFHACLDASRYRWRIAGTVPADAVLAVLGLERLELKAAAHSERARPVLERI
jgi:hypothetical protein